MKKTAYKTGLAAEAWCRLLLRLKAYRILATRYASPLGEIDIIAMRGKTLVVIEVKARPTHEQAVEAVHYRQRHRLENAARYFLGRNPHFQDHSLRFDIMLVSPYRWPHHIQNAWRPEISKFG